MLYRINHSVESIRLYAVNEAGEGRHGFGAADMQCSFDSSPGALALDAPHAELNVAHADIKRGIGYYLQNGQTEQTKAVCTSNMNLGEKSNDHKGALAHATVRTSSVTLVLPT
jgi:hypothetical protein